MLLAAATWAGGWVIALQGRLAEGIAQMREGISAWQGTGSVIWQPRFLVTLAEVYLSAGQATRGNRCLDGDRNAHRKNERTPLAGGSLPAHGRSEPVTR